MPVYEYLCEDCGHQFEVSQKMSDDPIKVCENCGKKKVVRVLFAPAIHFKGSGFHNTDYGTKSRPKEAATSDASGGKADAAGGGKSAAATPSSGGGSSDGAAKPKQATPADRARRGVGP